MLSVPHAAILDLLRHPVGSEVDPDSVVLALLELLRVGPEEARELLTVVDAHLLRIRVGIGVTRGRGRIRFGVGVGVRVRARARARARARGRGRGMGYGVGVGVWGRGRAVDAHREDEEGVDAEPLVELVDALREPVERHDTLLHDVRVAGGLADDRALEELEQAHLVRVRLRGRARALGVRVRVRVSVGVRVSVSAGVGVRVRVRVSVGA